MVGKILKSISCNWDDEGYIVKATLNCLLFLHLPYLHKNTVIWTPCSFHVRSIPLSKILKCYFYILNYGNLGLNAGKAIVSY